MRGVVSLVVLVEAIFAARIGLSYGESEAIGIVGYDSGVELNCRRMK